DSIMMERGEYATAAFYIVSAGVGIVEFKRPFGKATLFGGIVLSRPIARRTIPVACRLDVQTQVMDFVNLKRWNFRNPQSALRLLHRVVERLQRSGELLRPAVPSTRSL